MKYLIYILLSITIISSKASSLYYYEEDLKSAVSRALSTVTDYCDKDAKKKYSAIKKWSEEYGEDVKALDLGSDENCISRAIRVHWAERAFVSDFTPREKEHTSRICAKLLKRASKEASPYDAFNEYIAIRLAFVTTFAEYSRKYGSYVYILSEGDISSLEASKRFRTTAQEYFTNSLGREPRYDMDFSPVFHDVWIEVYKLLPVEQEHLKEANPGRIIKDLNPWLYKRK